MSSNHLSEGYAIQAILAGQLQFGNHHIRLKFGAFIWEIGKNLFGLYVANLANFGIVYGSLGTVIGLLTWTYLTGCLVSLCAELAVATEDWRTMQPPAIAVITPDINKPANELPARAEGQVVNVKTNDGRLVDAPESAKPAIDTTNLLAGPEARLS